jgi:hypothetical protein
MGFVVWEHFGYFCQGFRAVLPHEEIAVVGEWGEEGWVFGVDLIAETGQLEFADYAFLEEAG